MSAVAFDTLKFVEKLEAGGFSHAQAKATVEAFADVVNEQIVTRPVLREELNLLREEISPIKTEQLLMKWMIGFVLAFQVAIFVKTFIR